MITSTYLDISSVGLPLKRYFNFSNSVYLFKIQKNDFGQFYTIEVWDSTEKNLLFSNKIVYGQPFFDSVLAPIQDKIIPLNIDKLINGQGTDLIDDETLGNQIKLYTNIEES